MSRPGTVTPRSVKHARQVIDLPPIYADGLDAPELDAAIADRVESVPGGIAQQIVRLVVYDVPRPVARELDHAQIRAWKSVGAALSSRPAPAGAHRGHRRRARRAGDRRCPRWCTTGSSDRVLPAEIDRERFVARGVELVEQVETDGGDGT